MGWLIFGLLIILGGVVACAMMNGKTEEEIMKDENGRKVYDSDGDPVLKVSYPLKKWGGLVLGLSILLGILVILPSCFVSINTGETSVVKTFGKIEGTTLEPGFHAKAPWNDIQRYDTTVQQIKIVTNAYSKDGQTMDLEIYLQYQIQRDKLFVKDEKGAVLQAEGIAGKYVTLSSLQDRIETQCIEKTKSVMSSAEAMTIIQDRAVFSALVSETVRNAIGADYYVSVQDVVLTDISFSDAFERVVEDKVAQQQTYEKALIEQKQALAQAENEKEIAKTKAEAASEVAKIQAQADLDVQKINADAAEYTGKKEAAVVMNRLAGINGWNVVTTEDGICKLIKTDGTEITETERAEGVQKLIEYYYTQTWNGQLPDTYVGDDSVSSILIGK